MTLILPAEVVEHLNCGRNIDAIRTYRRITDCSLLEAKTAIDAYLDTKPRTTLASRMQFDVGRLSSMVTNYAKEVRHREDVLRDLLMEALKCELPEVLAQRIAVALATTT